MFFRHLQQTAKLERQAKLLQVAVTGFIDPRVLNLDDHIGAITQAGPVNLADGCGGVGRFLEVLEQVGDRLAQLRLHLRDNDLERHRRRFFLESLQGVREFLGQEILGLRGDLPHFHHGACEFTQGIGNLVRHTGITLGAGTLVVFLTAKQPARPLPGVLPGHGGGHACELEESSTA